MPHRDRHHSEDAVRITSVPRSRADDIAARQKRYIFSMAVRTICFVSAIVVGPGPLRWVLIVGAVFLPYVAVVMANAGPGRDNEAELRQVGGVERELPTTPTPGPIGGTRPGPDA
jgi:hypothetical protein